MPKGTTVNNWPADDVFREWWHDRTLRSEDIAARIGCHEATVRGHARRLGLGPRKRGPVAKPRDYDPVRAGEGAWVPGAHGILYWEASA